MHFFKHTLYTSEGTAIMMIQDMTITHEICTGVEVVMKEKGYLHLDPTEWCMNEIHTKEAGIHTECYENMLHHNKNIL